MFFSSTLSWLWMDAWTVICRSICRSIKINHKESQSQQSKEVFFFSFLFRFVCSVWSGMYSSHRRVFCHSLFNICVGFFVLDVVIPMVLFEMLWMLLTIYGCCLQCALQAGARAPRLELWTGCDSQMVWWFSNGWWFSNRWMIRWRVNVFPRLVELDC